MGCLLCCFEKIKPVEPNVNIPNFEIFLEKNYINYYLATRFDLLD